jgi:hypothetical protein
VSDHDHPVTTQPDRKLLGAALRRARAFRAVMLSYRVLGALTA